MHHFTVTGISPAEVPKHPPSLSPTTCSRCFSSSHCLHFSGSPDIQQLRFRSTAHNQPLTTVSVSFLHHETTSKICFSSGVIKVDNQSITSCSWLELGMSKAQFWTFTHKDTIIHRPLKLTGYSTLCPLQTNVWWERLQGTANSYYWMQRLGLLENAIHTQSTKRFLKQPFKETIQVQFQGKSYLSFKTC